MGIMQSMRADSIPAAVGVRRALISQLLFCLFFLSLTGTPANFSPEECQYVLDMVNR